jgi:hypothetical protein
MNDVMGRASAEGTVGGMNPAKLTCDDIVVRRNMTILGSMSARIVCAPGSAIEPSIVFSGASAINMAGIYGTSMAVSFAVGGANVGTFDSVGFVADAIRGTSGTIDFGGSTLVNVAGIVINPGSYEIVSNPVITVGVVDAVALAIPIVPHNVTKNCVLEISVKTIAVVLGTGGAENGVFDFRVRASLEVGETVPVVSAKYEISNYHSAGLTGAIINADPDTGVVNIVATGIAGGSVSWQTRANIVRVECD